MALIICTWTTIEDTLAWHLQVTETHTLKFLWFFYLPFDGAGDIEVVDVQVAVVLEVGLGKLETQLEILLTRLQKNLNYEKILYRDRSSNGIQLVYVALYCAELEIGLQWTQWWCEWALETAASVPKWTPPFSRLQKFKLWPLVLLPVPQSPRCVKMAGKVAMAALKSKEQALQEELTNFNALRKG